MSHKRKEIDEVTKKLQNTKKELDHLKAELQKQINSGINSAKQFHFSNRDKENLVHNFHETPHKTEARITLRNVSDVRNTHISRKDIPRLQPSVENGTTNSNTSKSPEYNQKCTYDREKVRDFIKKQKEKRKETAELTCKKTITDTEVKKQKLKELHLKSLQLVKKNVERNRKRSKSRENNQQTEIVAQKKNSDVRNNCQVVSHIPDLIITNVVDNKTAQKTESKTSRKIKEICRKDIEEAIQIKQNVAATKIQSYFRAYMQRQRYKKMKENKQTTPITKTTVETQTETKNKVVPDWLNSSTLSDPNNFISAVKRKLNLAVKSSPDLRIKTPEHSFGINTVVKTPSQELFQKTKDELKEVIQKSSKQNNYNLWEMISQIRSSDGIKSTEKSHQISESLHSKAVHSDTDTSKNIPNIDTHSIKSRKDVSFDTDYPTDSDFSEAKLNVEQLKHYRVQRKKRQENVEKRKEETNSSSSNLIKENTVNLLEYFPDKPSLPDEEPNKNTMKQDEDKAVISKTDNCNEIHLKIEAELHLNDINKSLKRFMDLEKSVLELCDKHMQKERNEKEIQSINYSRGSDVSDIMNMYSFNGSDLNFDRGILSTGLNLSSRSRESFSDQESTVIEESLLKEPIVGASLGTFEQLIKEEDRRIENLKLILKFREKTLLDRTKSELALLEIQRKHLKETGQLHEASLLKKKQRGILMRMQHEHHEMQRLKQMQKTVSQERKTDLKQKRNMIKAQLSTNKMLTKTKLNTSRDNQRQSGPFKVYNVQSHSESVRSETSVSRNSVAEEIISVTSHSRSVVSRVSDVEVLSTQNEVVEKDNELAKVEQVKKVLLMREAALQQRRKAVEEVLQWHKKLSEEEKKITELEMVAKCIIDEVAKEKIDEKMTKKEGALLTHQRNRDVHKYKSDKFSEKDSSYDSINTDIDYSSDVSSVIKTDVLVPNKSDQSKDGTAKQTLSNYTSDFEAPTSLENKEVFSEKIKHTDEIPSITELIDNLTIINEENSILSKRSSLNKSINEKIDALANQFYTDTNSKSSSKNFKPETNKLLNLKEHLHQDNSKAILDSIENLKSSIKEITSKADRSRTSRRNLFDTQSTEKDVSEINSHSESIPEHNEIDVTVEQKEVQSEICLLTSDESENITLATSVSFENTPHISDTTKSDVPLSENLEKPSEAYTSEAQNLSKLNVESQKAESPEDKNQNESNSEEHSKVTIEENKTLCEIDKETCPENHIEPILSASSPFIENSKLTESGNVAVEEKSDLLQSVDDNKVVEAENTTNSFDEDVHFQFEDEGISEETSPLLETESPSLHSKNENSYIPGDVKKRVSEILADVNALSTKNDKSPRLQDLYTTTYDVISSETFPEPYSAVDNSNNLLSSRVSLDAEAEELFKKQLAIEQEIKQIEQQHIPFIIMREIPNKPPPPYTPPVSSVQALTLPSVLPSNVSQVDSAIHFSSNILYSAYLANTLEAVSFEEQIIDENLLKNIDKSCLKFLFDVCKDLSIKHYEKFKVDEGPSWMKLTNTQKLSLNTPFNKEQLDKFLNKELKILLGYEKIERRENAIIRWSQKKRDHVDEILVSESQTEESEWTNYDRDELYVKNDVTNEIMKLLLSETAQIFSKILKKKCEKTGDLS